MIPPSPPSSQTVWIQVVIPCFSDASSLHETAVDCWLLGAGVGADFTDIYLCLCFNTCPDKICDVVCLSFVSCSLYQKNCLGLLMYFPQLYPSIDELLDDRGDEDTLLMY